MDVGSERRAAEEIDIGGEAARVQAVPEFPLRGRDGLELGLSPGPDLGRILAMVEQWWANDDFRFDRAACLERLKALIRQDG